MNLYFLVVVIVVVCCCCDIHKLQQNCIYKVIKANELTEETEKWIKISLYNLRLFHNAAAVEPESTKCQSNKILCYSRNYGMKS